MSVTDQRVHHQVLAGSVSNLLLFVGNLAVTFFLAPFLIAHLGDASYGHWALVESLTAYFTLLDLGISSCLVRFIAARPSSEWPRYTTTAFRTLAIVAGVGLAVVLPLGFLSSHPLFFILCMVPVATGLPMGVYPAVLDGMQATVLKSLLRLGLLLAKTVSLVVVIRNQPTLNCLGVVLGVFTLLEQVLLYGIVRKVQASLSSERSPSVTGWNRAAFREMLSLSKQAFVILLSGRMAVQSGPILIGLMLNAPHVAFYAIAFRLVDTGKSALRTATSTLTAAFGTFSTRSNLKPIQTLYRYATRWTLYAVIPMQIGIWFWGEWFLRCWLPEGEYARQGGPVLCVLALSLTMSLAQSLAARILYGLGDLSFFARVSMLEAITGVLLALILIPSFGLVGLGVAITLPNLLADFWVLHYTHRRIELPFRDYLQEWIPPYLCGLSLNFFWTALLMLRLPIGNFYIVLSGVLVYGLCVLIVEGRVFERQSVRSRIIRRLPVAE
ncbi:polysaccharide biosynthesis C-terminal domain-containing protein [Telmatocola sphagniphila]|uniref:Polysaccharide biosynthesis C-terminal domain-containing protein n=1 Tax=Telmatocola sphagniphila TaxID=1123043 RepID=A0A8E6EUF6_9BACT|nr:polysaccharide biosynthesis C-terminal domain-containing protein [Telmatocola sphagniphila]QVL31330.1 polysaccharide biosynthesis C-terminal domain-containing protein [Telmatocola sphagniphila]